MTKHNRTDVLLGGGTSGLDGTCLVHALSTFILSASSMLHFKTSTCNSEPFGIFSTAIIGQIKT